jgi:hypothetical protein
MSATVTDFDRAHMSSIIADDDRSLETWDAMRDSAEAFEGMPVGDSDLESQYEDRNGDPDA